MRLAKVRNKEYKSTHQRHENQIFLKHSHNQIISKSYFFSNHAIYN